jgi:hypothetical protein
MKLVQLMRNILYYKMTRVRVCLCVHVRACLPGINSCTLNTIWQPSDRWY